jgi:hypothetical protein
VLLKIYLEAPIDLLNGIKDFHQLSIILKILINIMREKYNPCDTPLEFSGGQLELDCDDADCPEKLQIVILTLFLRSGYHSSFITVEISSTPFNSTQLKNLNTRKNFGENFGETEKLFISYLDYSIIVNLIWIYEDALSLFYKIGIFFGKLVETFKYHKSSKMKKVVCSSESISEQQLDNTNTGFVLKNNEWLLSKRRANKYQEMIPYIVG